MKHIRWISVVLIALFVATNSEAQSKTEMPKMINRSTPILHVKEVEPCIRFWTEKFGFKVTIQVPENGRVGFVALENGAIELMYQTYSGMKADPKNPLADAVEKGLSFLFMEVGDINATIKAINKTEIVQGLHETFYGAKEVIAREPGGHFVIFSQLPAPK